MIGLRVYFELTKEKRKLKSATKTIKIETKKSPFSHPNGYTSKTLEKKA